MLVGSEISTQERFSPCPWPEIRNGVCRQVGTQSGRTMPLGWCQTIRRTDYSARGRLKSGRDRFALQASEASIAPMR
jgi:hypothetical protein